MDYPETRVHYDSDWTPMYVILAAIPIIFVMAAVYTTCCRRTKVRRESVQVIAREPK